MKAVVVGAGIVGASTAYQLARAGCEVTVIDRADAGRATAAGAGIICPWGSPIEDAANYGLLAGGARYYPEFVAMLAADGEPDVGYAAVGGLYVPKAARDLDAVEARVRARATMWPVGEVARLSAHEAQALFPPLRRDQPALYVSGGARVDGRRLARALQRAGARYRVQFETGSAELMVQKDRAVGVRVAGKTMAADVVVVAAGAWASAMLAPVGVRLAVAPQRGQILHLRRPPIDTARWPVLMPLDSYYLLAFEDSRVVVGATRETGSGFDYRVTAAGAAEVLNAGLAVAPGLRSWTLDEIRIGFRPLALDEVPKLGPVPGLDNLLIGNGLGPSGLTMGPYCGLLLAQAALGKDVDFTRFAVVERG
jgi:D-amino-acid dehydrogenase